MSSTKLYVSASSPVIEAAIGKMFSFATREQALEKISHLRERFIISNEQESADSVILWIKNFSIEEDEKKKGGLGNYARVKILQLENQRWTLSIEKLPRDVSTHPQRFREKKAIPDWGHFVLRAVRKKKIYPTLEEAEKQLMTLHEEFPGCSIPAKHKLYTFIYQKPEKDEAKKKPGAVKHILVIKAAKDGGFLIEAKENKRPPKTNITNEKPKESKGYFASMVELKKR